MSIVVAVVAVFAVVVVLWGIRVGGRGESVVY
jgi:hypothetical protein